MLKMKLYIADDVFSRGLKAVVNQEERSIQSPIKIKNVSQERIKFYIHVHNTFSSILSINITCNYFLSH